MKIYHLQVTISGMNGEPETREEFIIASQWNEVCDLVSRICRDTGCVILSMTITKTDSVPLEFRKSSDE